MIETPIAQQKFVFFAPEYGKWPPKENVDL